MVNLNVKYATPGQVPPGELTPEQQQPRTKTSVSLGITASRNWLAMLTPRCTSSSLRYGQHHWIRSRNYLSYSRFDCSETRVIFITEYVWKNKRSSSSFDCNRNSVIFTEEYV